MEIGSMTMEQHISAHSATSLSVRKYCEANGIKEHTFRYWKKRFDGHSDRGNFKLVDKVDSLIQAESQLMKIVFPNQIELIVYHRLDPQYIRRLMEC